MLGDARLEPGETVHLSWTAANRDPRVFDEPDGYDPAAHHEANLVFGTGPHVCPGRALTLMVRRVAVEELLGRTARREPSDQPAVREDPPLGGWAAVPVVLR